MKVCIFGAGAVGGFIATRFSLAGEDVTVIDRGPHLAAIKSGGIKLEWEDGSVKVAKVKTVGEASDAGRQDLVVLAVKAHSLEQVAKEIHTLLEPATIIMTVQNGIPWWYFQKHGGDLDGRRLLSLDPNGTLTAAIDVDRIVSCVVYPAVSLVAPGIVRHIEGDYLPVGQPDGKITPRVLAVDALLAKAKLRSRVLSDIRAEIWLKALGTLSFNPISALTRATMVEICRFSEARQLTITMMREAQTVAERLGISMRHTVEKRLEGAEAVGAHKTSMLQDVEAGRPLETEALVGAILEMGRLTKTPTPAIETVYALTKLLDHQMRAKPKSSSCHTQK